MAAVEAYHNKKFQVRDGEHNIIIFPVHFLLEALTNY